MACNCKNKNNSSKAVKTPVKTNTTTSVNRPSTQQKRIMRREIK